ncbi:aldo/keto reductase [Bifidobacterium xylocopae]|uniref:Aldo/keto reductase n=2 Tax=Bifidobacterium xylocopae TaxID=2493119 RepID=A0A366KCG0_9BIFI|nr:aldo/keto reductase [Bifidobacterium xylocopae]RBP99426.1 aldo/keto reductase [Bifidobacterium xylocopae]
MTLLTRTLGFSRTTAVGLGCMGLSIEGKPAREQAVQTIHDALDAGCRHLDTAWSYYASGGPEQTNENLVREALASWKGPKDEVLVATKVGHFRNFDRDGKPGWGVDGRPETLIRRAKESARALGVDTIDLLYMHRPDPDVPYQESIEAMAQLVHEGVARQIGISNADLRQIDLARGVLGKDLVAVQNQFSPLFRDTRKVLDYTGQVNLAFVCWSPLGGFRKPKDESKFAPFRQVAQAHGVSFQQVVLAWELAQGEHVFVLPGAHRPQTILDSLKAGELKLSRDELATLD